MLEIESTASGTGDKVGVQGLGYSASSSWTEGVEGWASTTGSGIVFGGRFLADNSGTGTHYGVYGAETSGGSGAAVYASGDMGYSGSLFHGVTTSRGGRKIYPVESAEAWVEDVGEGRLVDGRGRIELDPLLRETVTIDDDHPMQVFVQLTSGDPVPTVVERGTTGFTVRVADESSEATFSWRVLAKRKGHEADRMVETNVLDDDPNFHPEILEEMEARREAERQRHAREREEHQKLEQDHQANLEQLEARHREERQHLEQQREEDAHRRQIDQQREREERQRMEQQRREAPPRHPEPLRPEGIRQAPDGPRPAVSEPVTAPAQTAALRHAPKGGAR